MWLPVGGSNWGEFSFKTKVGHGLNIKSKNTQQIGGKYSTVNAGWVHTYTYFVYV